MNVSQTLLKTLLSPISEGANQASSLLVSIWDRYVNLINTEEENKQLIKKINKLKGSLGELVILKSEVTRLREMLNLQPKLPLKLKIAEIVALDMSLERNAFWINKGTSSGIKSSQPVIDSRGVVGQVFMTFPKRSLVLTIRDPLFRLHVMNARTDERAVFTGEVNKDLHLLRYLHRESDVRVGDFFMTSGIGGVFPHGLGVGKVRKIDRPITGLESKVWLSPAVNIYKMNEVFVVLAKKSKK